jgi:glycosyltransferase involved in cell wall biosynthesis
MNKKNAKIGYAVANIGMDAPAFRRRFGFYLKERNLSWEIADIKKTYDLVVVHHSADITAWRNYSKAKIILDYNDDYLYGSVKDLKSIGRGVSKFLFRQWTNLEFDFRTAYIKMMKRADAVVCCTDLQEDDVKKYCSNVHQIFDIHYEPEWIVKNSYDSGLTTNLVWEGLPDFSGLIKLMPTLRDFQTAHSFALHLVTSLKHGKYLRTIGQVNTKDAVSRMIDLKQVFLYEWNRYLFSHIITSCDLAIIPIDMQKPLWISKPANKLLQFWRFGIPTLVDPSPAYIKLMNECGLDMVCHSTDEWGDKLDRYSSDKEARKSAGIKGKNFVNENYSIQKLLGQWDAVLDSVLL